ncbi:MAG: hypothetical protein JRI68_04595 [Deltaproteobacteria bacterium]|nr:hypothetical protein [Deltaproteobacteria bacterium]
MNQSYRKVTTSNPAARRIGARLAKMSLAALVVLLASPLAQGQPEPLGPPPVPPPPATPAGPTAAPAGSEVVAKDWTGAVRVLRVPGASGTGPAEARAASEIFPDSSKVWMHVYGTDPRPIEAARRGARKWICSAGCQLSLGDGGGSSGSSGDPSIDGDKLLRSIKLQTPTQPLPLTIWRPTKDGSGKLLFDPSVLGRRSYSHVCAYPPVTQGAKIGDEVPRCPRQAPPETPTPDSAAVRVGFLWPKTSELATFEYIAITDTCGNARVQPYQRMFNVPVFHVASGGCGAPDGRVLRVFPSGGWLRVTAFNLDTPAAGNVVSATFRVSIPPLEDLVSDDQPRLLFPDPVMGDITIDCGPMVLKARSGPAGIPRHSPGTKLPGQKAPPGKSLPGQKTPPGKTPVGGGAKAKAPGPVAPKPRVVKPRVIAASSPSAQPMAHQGLVIAPEPLLRGNCRIRLGGQQKRRLLAPLALRVKITRTDQAAVAQVLLNDPWIVTPNDATFHIKPLNIDGESRLRVEVFADPKSGHGNVILLGDAGRVAREQPEMGEDWQRLIGSVTVYSAPLCGESNFETVEGVGSCLRGYFTVPAMLATLQVTRAPWVERPLVTRSILSAVGIAFAVDSYDPVEREAFPIAAQLGAFVQDLGDERIGILSYLGVAPTLPILGEGGNTTSIGLLGGIGIEYITSANGPDEGFKPAAFLSVVVQVGQANPAASAGGAAFGAYQAPPPGQPGMGTY